MDKKLTLGIMAVSFLVIAAAALVAISYDTNNDTDKLVSVQRKN